MRSYRAVACVLILSAAAVGSGLQACATGQDASAIMGLQGTSSTSGGNTSSSGSADATTSSSGGNSSSGGSSSGSYTDDSTVTPTPDSATGDDGYTAPQQVGPTCTPGQTCVDAVPSGWTGFVQLLVNNVGVDAGCSGAYGQVQPSIGGQTNPDGGPATCGACTCSVPEAGLGCSVTVEQDNTGCFPIGTLTEVPVQAGSCTAVGGLSGWNGKSSTPAGSGQCVGSGSAVTTPPPAPTYSMAVACGQGDAGAAAAPEGGAGTTCQSGQACADMPVAGGDSGLPSGVCIYQSGIQTCPPGGTTLFTNTFVVGAVEDSRGCGCTCGAGTCPGDGYITGFTASGCTGTPSYTLDAGIGCQSGISGSSRPKYVSYHPSHGSSQGACGTATAGPTGAVDIDGGTATTFCCIP